MFERKWMRAATVGFATVALAWSAGASDGAPELEPTCDGCVAWHSRTLVWPATTSWHCALSITVMVSTYDGACLAFDGSCYPLVCTPSLHVWGDCSWNDGCSGGFDSLGHVCSNLWGPVGHTCGLVPVDIYNATMSLGCGDECSWEFDLKSWSFSGAATATVSGTLRCSSCTACEVKK